jgi:hypothetical protein
MYEGEDTSTPVLTTRCQGVVGRVFSLSDTYAHSRTFCSFSKLIDWRPKGLVLGTPHMLRMTGQSYFGLLQRVPG